MPIKKSFRVKKAVSLILCLFMAGILSGCSVTNNSYDTPDTSENALSKYKPAPVRKVIIDTDAGADDAMALILAAKSGNIDILGVTVLAGNVDLEQATKNALSALEIAGCDAPVFKGSAENFNSEKIDAFSIFGTDGMGDAGLVHPKGKAEDQDAIDFILETVKANPDEVEIVAIGPATNIAKAIKRDPDTMKQVKRIWSMGTAGLGPGNATPVAEFNAYHDPEAYQIMLDASIPVTVVGLDICRVSTWSEKQFEELGEANEIGHFAATSFTKIREFFAKERSGKQVDTCDALAVMCLVYDNFVTETIDCHGSCITQKGETRGQVLFYQKGYFYDVAQNDFDYNVKLVKGVCSSDYFDLFLQVISK